MQINHPSSGLGSIDFIPLTVVITGDMDLIDCISIILYPPFREECNLGVVENSNMDEIEDIVW